MLIENTPSVQEACSVQEEKVAYKTRKETITDESSTNYSSFNELKHYIQGKEVGLPNSYELPINQLPSWFNYDLYKKGQEYAMENYFSVCIAEMISLFIVFSFPKGLATLIFTNKSNNKETAGKRYLSTINTVRSWFEEDLLDPESKAFKNMKVVRALHLNADKIIRSLSDSEIQNRCNLDKIVGNELRTTPLLSKALNDFEQICPLREEIPEDNHIHIDQARMSMTQFAFMGLIILYPTKFGAKYSKAGLEGFTHLWRFIGYLLGIDEKYNFCAGSFEEVRERSRLTVEYAIKPQLRYVNGYWEHMLRSMIDGIGAYLPGVCFEDSLLFFCWVMEIESTQIRKYLGPIKSLKLHLKTFVFYFLSKVEIFHCWLNQILIKFLLNATNKCER